MYCRICFIELKYEGIKSIFINNIICNKCFHDLNPKFERFIIMNKYKGLAIYEYNSKIRECLFMLKGNKDYAIADVFINNFLHYLKMKYLGFTMVFAPSYFKDDLERGFNHVEAIFKNMNLPQLHVLHKSERIKQTGLKREERMKIGNYIYIDNVDLSKKRLLLVDDVYTTGSTIKACISLLESKNPISIQILVMSRRKMNNVEMY